MNTKTPYDVCNLYKTISQYFYGMNSDYINKSLLIYLNFDQAKKIHSMINIYKEKKLTIKRILEQIISEIESFYEGKTRAFTEKSVLRSLLVNNLLNYEGVNNDFYFDNSTYKYSINEDFVNDKLFENIKFINNVTWPIDEDGYSYLFKNVYIMLDNYMNLNPEKSGRLNFVSKVNMITSYDSKKYYHNYKSVFSSLTDLILELTNEVNNFVIVCDSELVIVVSEEDIRISSISPNSLLNICTKISNFYYPQEHFLIIPNTDFIVALNNINDDFNVVEIYTENDYFNFKTFIY